MRRSIKQATEALTVLAIASYAIGFIIVNSYLLTFGYSSSSLFKTTYISAGILFLLLSAPLALALYSFVTSLQTATHQDESPVFIRRMLPLVVMGTLLFISYELLSQVVTSDLRKSQDELPGWEKLIWGLCMTVALILLLHEMGSIRSSWFDWLNKYHGLSMPILFGTVFFSNFQLNVALSMALTTVAAGMAMMVLLAGQPLLDRVRNWSPGIAAELAFTIVLWLWAIGFFSTAIYGHIKPQYGGGQPPRVRVVISDANRTLFRPSFLPSRMESMLADTQLIDSNDKSIVVLLKSSYDDKGVAFQIDRSLIDAVLYLSAP